MSTLSKFRLPLSLGACLFGAIGLFFLWQEHRVHLLGALPYVFLLLCPLMHLLMHRGHGHGHSTANEHEGHSHHRNAS